MPTALIIDDTEQIRGLFRSVLEQADFVVSDASTGSSGVQLFRQEPTDVVITDLYMPEGDGLTVIRELRADYPDVKILAVSGTDALDVKLHEARALGADAILFKPVGVEDLLNCVERLLGRTRTRFRSSA